MRKLWFSLVFLCWWGCVGQGDQDYDCGHPDKFMRQIKDYIDECSMHYYKIRACDRIELYTAYDIRFSEVWDSLRLIYPDSMVNLVKVEGEPKKPTFKIGEQAFEKIPDGLKNRVGQLEIEVEYEVDLGCCDEKICCSQFRFNSDSILVSIRESGFYLTIPGRYTKDFVDEYEVEE